MWGGEQWRAGVDQRPSHQMDFLHRPKGAFSQPRHTNPIPEHKQIWKQAIWCITCSFQHYSSLLSSLSHPYLPHTGVRQQPGGVRSSRGIGSPRRELWPQRPSTCPSDSHTKHTGMHTAVVLCSLLSCVGVGMFVWLCFAASCPILSCLISELGLVRFYAEPVLCCHSSFMYGNLGFKLSLFNAVMFKNLLRIVFIPSLFMLAYLFLGTVNEGSKF